MIATVEYLRQFGLDKLVREFAIKTSRHGQHHNLVLLGYNPIESPMHLVISQECRGLIVDEANNWNPVAFPYTKFFNHGEHLAADIDWKTASVQEKVDGSLVSVYTYKGEWHCSTTGVADADTRLPYLPNQTFKWLFWNTWEQLHYKMPRHENMCYLFELASPYNRVVVQHGKPDIIMHGARDMSTLKEVDPVGIANEYGWKCVKRFPLTTLDETIEACKKLDPLAAEGFVVCDGNFNRVKIKSPAYVALHHLICSMSPRNMLKLIMHAESDEFLCYFPELKKVYDLVYSRYIDFTRMVDDDYARFSGIEEQKEFALAIDNLAHKSLLHIIRKGQATDAKGAFARMFLKSAEKLLDLKSIDFVQVVDAG